MKLWAGRFQSETDQGVNDFNSSIRFDSRMFREDIKGSCAHAAMLAACGIISPADADAIRNGLEEIEGELEAGTLPFDPAAEDIHMFLEQQLTQRIGEAGKRLHTARSRNDQVAVDLRLYLNTAVAEVSTEAAKLVETLLTLSEEHKDQIMPGYTHLQRAQPISFGHHLMAYAWMLLRDLDRLKDAKARMMRDCPLGSGALAGTTYPIDRGQTAAALGFQRPAPNSLDGVSDRDYCLELLAAFSILMTHLSRFAEEIILWCSWEFKFIELDDAFATGSSIMPQKKNPDVAELVRGKSGRVFGSLQALLTVMKGLPLAYNKDMQEDKEAVFDALDTVMLCLTTFTPMLATMRVNGDNMRKAAAKGFINATDCADYLVGKGMAFRDAYKVTGELVALCIERDTTLEALPLEEYRSRCPLFGEDLYAAINLDRCMRSRTSEGGPASVPEQITLARRELEAYR